MILLVDTIRTSWYCDEEDTLWKANTEPKSGGLEDDFPFQKGEQKLGSRSG